MKNKKEMMRGGNKKILIIGILLFLISIALIVLVLSPNQSLQEELTGLEQNLSDSGYSWLINHSKINKSNFGASEQGVSKAHSSSASHQASISQSTNQQAGRSNYSKLQMCERRLFSL